MKEGELFKCQFDVQPCSGGGFLVRVDEGPCVRKEYAFTNLFDMLRWFQKQAHPLIGSQQPQHEQRSLKDALLAKAAQRVANGPEKPIPLPGSGYTKVSWWKRAPGARGI